MSELQRATYEIGINGNENDAQTTERPQTVKNVKIVLKVLQKLKKNFQYQK